MSARRYNGASGGGASSASKSGSKRQSRPMTQADIERKSWADAVPSLRERAERMAQQPIGDLHPPRSTVNIYTAAQYRAYQARIKPGLRPAGLDREVHNWETNKGNIRTRAAAEQLKAATEAGPDRATELRYARLNSPEGKAVRTTIRDTMLQLEVARAQTRAEKFGTQAYTKAKAREQALGAKLKAANERQRGIESGKIKVTGVAKPAATPKAPKAASAARTPKESGPKLGKAVSFDESFNNEHLVSDQYNALLSGMTVKTGYGSRAATYRVVGVNGDRLTVMERIRRFGDGGYSWQTKTGEATRQQLFDALNVRLSPGARAIQVPTDLYPDRQSQSA